jgi:phosphoglycerol transferase MdoB-like AlkP superfamily enzyme
MIIDRFVPSCGHQPLGWWTIVSRSSIVGDDSSREPQRTRSHGRTFRRAIVSSLVLLSLITGWQDPTSAQITKDISSAPNLQAKPVGRDPNTSLRSVTVDWSTGSSLIGDVFVSKDATPETLFARGPRGSARADWIERGSTYEFRLYDAATHRLLFALTVNDESFGDPAGPTLNTTTLHRYSESGQPLWAVSWTTGNGRSGAVYVSRDSQPDGLLAEASRGTVTVDWIDSRSDYEFKLYLTDARAPRTLVATSRVRAALWTRPSAWLVAGCALVLAAFVASAWWAVRRRAARGPGGTAAWFVRWGPAAFLIVALFMKVVHAGLLPSSNGLDTNWFVLTTASLASVLLISTPALMMPRLSSIAALIAIDLIISALLLSDELYFRRYLDVISVQDLGSAPVLFERFGRAVVVGLLRPTDALHVLDFVIVLAATLVNVSAATSESPSTRVRARVALVTLTIGGILAMPMASVMWRTRFDLHNPTVRGVLIGSVGVLPYHAYDGLIRMVSPDRDLPDEKSIRAFLEDRQSARKPSRLTGIAKGKNLIMIQAESLQSFPIGVVLDGQPVAPHLAAFAAESMQFANFFDQTHHGFTSDGEFTTLTSLHPLPEGSASVTLRTNHYRSLPTILSSFGYRTVSACGASGAAWSMAMTHPAHGFDVSLFEDRFEPKEVFKSLSDGEFFAQMLRRLGSEPRPFAAFLITSSNHGSPSEVPLRQRTLKLPPRLLGTVLGDYLQSVNYFDRVFGELISGLRDTGLLDESIVALYGDHQAYLNQPAQIAELISRASDSTFQRWLTEKRLPWLVRLPRAAERGVRTHPTGHLDIAPTLLSLLGVNDDNRVMLGRDATSDTEPLVVFRDSGFANADVAYTQPRLMGAPACFSLSSGAQVRCQDLEAEHANARQQLAVSDGVLKRDLLPTLLRTPLAKSVADLPQGHAFSPRLGDEHVVISGADLWAPAPSGVTFVLPVDQHVVQVRATPVVDYPSHAASAPPVMFEVWAGGRQVESRVVTARNEAPLAVELELPREEKSATISFVTRTVGPLNGTQHLAVWQGLRILPIDRSVMTAGSGSPGNMTSTLATKANQGRSP